MATAELRGEPEEDFREGSAYNISVRMDLSEGTEWLELEDKFSLSRNLEFEISDREKLAQLVERKYDDKVVAVNVETGEELAVADDTHELTKMLLELEYNEEATMIVRCHGGEERSHPA